MDYQLENLGPEKFQEVCQALITKSFPRTQCLPVGQPDGGRDAIQYERFHRTKQETDSFIVFQVKFVREPNTIEDKLKWVEGIIKGEKDKINKLIRMGAKHYYLLTNVKGTAHLSAGSIDKIHAYINKEIAIPSQCWWRDDLLRRLDDSYDIKWAYPDILSGPDVLRMIIQEGLTENSERRTNAIRAFLKEQYEIDKHVKFKQVDLQCNLFDIFVDLPAEILFGESPGGWDAIPQMVNTLSRINAYDPEYSERFHKKTMRLNTPILMRQVTVERSTVA